MKFKIGHGIDVHQLADGESLMLGGIKIDSLKGTLGHSDGDALLHALTDAILGSLALGDIGTFFPSNNDKWKIAIGCMLEAYKIGLKKGIKFSFTEPIEYVTQFGNAMPKARPSMLLDHKAQRLSEIDSINGMVNVLGKETNVPTPFNQKIVALVKELEKTFKDYK